MLKSMYPKLVTLSIQISWKDSNIS